MEEKLIMDNTHLSENEDNEIEILDVIKILFNNMREKNELELIIISRKTLIEMSLDNLELIVHQGVENIKTLISNMLLNISNAESQKENLLNFVSLFKDIIDNYGKNFDKKIVKEITSFYTNLYQGFCSNPTLKEQDKAKNQQREEILELVSKIIIYLANLHFHEVNEDLFPLFSPGTVPNKILVDLFVELSTTYSNKSVSYYYDIISRMTSGLTNVMDTHLRVSISKFFSHVCENIILQRKDGEINSENKEADIIFLFSTCYDLIQGKWVQQSQIKSLYIINTVMMMSILINEVTIKNNFDFLMGLFITYVKNDDLNETYILTKSLRIFLEININKYKEKMEHNLTNILISLISVLTSIYVSPNVKNFNENFLNVKSEVLKIFHYLFKNFQEKVYSFLLSRFDFIPLIDRLTIVYLFKGLLLRVELTSQKELLLNAVCKAVFDNDFEYRYALIDLTYVLFERNLVTKEHSMKLISYLLRESGISDQDIALKADIYESYPFYTNLSTVKEKAEKTLIDLVTKVNNTEYLFWPVILEYFVESNLKYNESGVIICQIIQIIYNNFISQNKDFGIDYKNNRSIPEPNIILIRFFSILAFPFKRKDTIKHTLSCFKILLPILFGSVNFDNINTQILEEYVETKSKCFYQEEYFDVLCNLWENVLKEVKLKESFTVLNENLTDQITKTNNDSKISLLLRLKGYVLSRISKKEIICDSLDQAFSVCHPEYKYKKINGNLDQSNPTKELKNGVAEFFGLTASVHLDSVLEKIYSIFKADILYKRPSGITALFSKTVTPELSPYIISTLILSLGYISKYSDTNTLAARVEKDLLPQIDIFFRGEKKGFKLSCLTAFGLTFQALLKVSSSFVDQGEVFLLGNRDEYLTSMMLIFRNEKILNEIKVHTLNNMALLIKLDPPITLDQAKNFIHLVFTIFDYTMISSTYKDKIYETALEKANDILEGLLYHEVHLNLNDKSAEEGNFINVDIYENILNYDKEYFNSWDTFTYILEKFLEKFLKSPKEFKPILIERIECFFRSKKSFERKPEEINNWAASFICLFSILFDEDLDDEDENIDDIENSNNSIFLCFAKLFRSSDMKFKRHEKTKFTVELAELISKSLGLDEYLTFFKYSTILLKSISLNVNKYASVFLLKLISARSNDFMLNESDNSHQEKIQDLFESLINISEYYVKEEKITGVKTNDQFKNVLIIIFEISILNSQCLLKSLLNEKFGLPLTYTFTSLLHRISLEKSLTNKIIPQLIEIINDSNVIIDNTFNYSVNVSTIVLGTLLEVKDENLLVCVRKLFPQIFSTLIERIGSAHASVQVLNKLIIDKDLDPRAQAVWSIRQLLKHCEQSELRNSLDEGLIHCKLIDSNEYDEAIYELTLLFCKKAEFSKLKVLFDHLIGYLNKNLHGYKVATISCFAQYINFSSNLHCKDDKFDVNSWRKEIINILIEYLDYDNFMVRKMSIRGISNLCKLYLDCCVYIDNYIKSSEMLKEDEIITDEKRQDTKNSLKKNLILDNFTEELLKRIVDKLEDKYDIIVLEALNLIQQLLDHLDESSLTFLVTILLDKIKPCFNKDYYQIRSSSFIVFNKIVALIPNETKENDEEKNQQFYELIKNHIHFNLTSLLLHSNDENQSVKNNSMKTLLNGLSLILNKDMTNELNKCKDKVGDEYNRVYDEFISVTCMLLCEKYADSINCHINNCLLQINSNQENIRANSIYLIGVLYTSLQEQSSQYLSEINMRKIYRQSSLLLKDVSLKVRLRTVKSLSFFKTKK